MNPEIKELCWIIDKRNKWAQRRGVLRHRLRRAIESDKPKSLIIKLEQDFNSVNSEKSECNKHTGRLRILTRRLNVRLVSDRNAGYDCILFRNSSDYIRGSYISDMAREYEMELAIYSAISST
jgi:hypothetical protein